MSLKELVDTILDTQIFKLVFQAKKIIFKALTDYNEIQRTSPTIFSRLKGQRQYETFINKANRFNEILDKIEDGGQRMILEAELNSVQTKIAVGF